MGSANRLGYRSLEMQPRDRWINWSDEQKYERLQYITNNQRFLILPGVSIKNLASRVLALNVKRLSADWETVYGHPIVMVETFVDHSRFKAICYRAAGWVPLGMTNGLWSHRRHLLLPRTVKNRPCQGKSLLPVCRHEAHRRRWWRWRNHRYRS